MNCNEMTELKLKKQSEGDNKREKEVSTHVQSREYDELSSKMYTKSNHNKHRWKITTGLNEAKNYG